MFSAGSDDATIAFVMSEEQDRPAMLSDLATWKNDLTSLIREEGETTRRHFEIVAENMSGRVKVVADGATRSGPSCEGGTSLVPTSEGLRRWLAQ